MSLIKEGHHGPCPISTANQLHAAGYTRQEVDQFIQNLLGQFQAARQNDYGPSRGREGHVSTPNRGGIIGGLGFGGNR